MFRPRLADHVARTIKKGALLVEGFLVSLIYERPSGKGKKSRTTKITSWSICADSSASSNRNEQGPAVPASVSAQERDEAPF